MPMETSHIWLGRFVSEQAVDAYFAESYSEGDDEAPINQFAAEQGESFYDHDWLERSYSSSCDLRAQVSPHSYSESYLDRVLALSRERGALDAHVFILADEGEFSQPRSIEAPDHVLWDLGTFVCKVK